MTYREAYLHGVQTLSQGPYPTESPELDARILLAHGAGLSHAGLLSRWADSVPEAAVLAFDLSLARRVAGEPVAWITGFKEFLGMDFEVGPGLLVPRADTETLVEAGLEVLTERDGSARVVDVCTGTGCVAVGLAASAPTLEVWATDVSPLAVETAQRNAQRLLTPPGTVTVVEGDLLSALPGPWDLVVSNPPYLTSDETTERKTQGWREPALALDGGPDGLVLIRRLVDQAVPALNPGGWLLIEAADAQMDSLLVLCQEAGLTECRWWKDLAGQRRVVGGRRPPNG